MDGLWWELNVSFAAAFGRFFCFIHHRKKTMQIAFFEGAARRGERVVLSPQPGIPLTDCNETINTGACSIVGPTITLKSDSSKLSHNGQLKQPTSANFSAPLYATLRPTARGAHPPLTSPLFYPNAIVCSIQSVRNVWFTGKELCLY